MDNFKEELADRKKKKREVDTNYISTFGLKNKIKKTKKTELLNQGYKLYIENGKTVLKKGNKKITMN